MAYSYGSHIAVVVTLCQLLFFFQAEDGIRDLVRSRGLGDVYKRQVQAEIAHTLAQARQCEARGLVRELGILYHPYDLERGQAQPVEQVAQRLNSVWTPVSYTHLTLPTSDLV